MCEIWEEVRREGIELAKDEIEKAEVRIAQAGAKARERATKTALRMIKRDNLSVEEIAEYTGLTEDEVKEYQELIAG